MSNTSEQSLAFDQGYEGTFDENGQPHGKGRMKFKDDDDFDRNVYDGGVDPWSNVWSRPNVLC